VSGDRLLLREHVAGAIDESQDCAGDGVSGLSGVVGGDETVSRTWSLSSKVVSTALLSSPTCSGSLARPSTGRVSENVLAST